MRAPPAHFDPVCGLSSNEINPRATFVSSKFRWSLQSTAVVAHHASLFPTDSPAAAGPAATPGHLGPQRPQRRPRNGSYVPAPEFSPCTRRHLEPAHNYAVCGAANHPARCATHADAAACYFRILEPAQSPPFHWAGPDVPLVQDHVNDLVHRFQARRI